MKLVEPKRRNATPWVVFVILCLAGLPLSLGGARLAALGGSFYYLFAGIALIASGGLIARRRMIGVWMSGAFLTGTVAWSLWEVGPHYWLLVPRLVVPVILSLLAVLCIPGMEQDERRRPARARAAIWIAGALGLILIVTGALAFVPRHLIGPVVQHPVHDGSTGSSTSTEWWHYGRTLAGTRFSPADQISPSNVHALKVAWTYRMGDPEHHLGEHQVTPLQVGSSLYLCTHRNEVIALDAESGRQLWRFNPQTTVNTYRRCRGVGYHETRDESSASPVGSCQRRVLTSTIDARLIALDAQTGQPCRDFGIAGVVDLKVGLGEVKHDYYFQTSAPTVVRDLVIIGGLVRDGVDAQMPSGVVRAFSAKTGALVWAWDPGNPAITGSPPPGETYTRGAPNFWSAATYDESLGLIYLPLGEPTGATDLWGGWRSKELEKYANSVVALDVTTGRPRWHFQTVHHDLWDYDLPAQPTLFDLPDGAGGTIPALIQGSKRGQIFLLDRRNGEPIAPVEEKPVPQEGQPDDWLSPTQPYSVGMPAIGGERLTEASMWGMTPFDQLWCRIQFKRLRYEGDFTPPTTGRRALMYPGVLGGMNWGGVSVDENLGYLLVNDIRVPMQIGLLPGDEYNRWIEKRKAGEAGSHWIYVTIAPNVPYGGAFREFLSPLGIPCNAPPWGTLTAIHLSSRRILWQIPMGTARDTGPLGFKLRLPFPIGLPTLGGSLVLRSGLVFFAGSADFYLRAIDVRTGAELWKKRLPVGAQATPMTYVSPKSGRQFVAVAAGGTRMSMVKGDYVIAYALPEMGRAERGGIEER